MSTTTEPVAVSTLRVIRLLTEEDTPDAEIASILQAGGVGVPRDGADHHALSDPTGYNLPTNPGDPGRWQAETVAAIRESVTYRGFAESGFPQDGSVQLVL